MTAADTGRRREVDYRHVALGETISTNSECLSRARAGDSGNLWVTASRQTGGRGRRGRAWASEPGNLYSSLLLIDLAPMERIGSLPLAVAVAVQEAVRSVMPAGGNPVEVKWPNDVLIGRKKTSGILIEGEALSDGRYALVIGIGINVAVMPDNPLYPVTSLAEQGAAVSPEELFAHLYAAMAEALKEWNGGHGVADTVARWRRVACGIGEKIMVNLPDRSISGHFAGIDDSGLLKLDTGDGRLMTIAAGDVFFG
ncbi:MULTISPECIES: biotin--[acetyl-CoA-carboxylase] ligase [Rhizobium]|uniref:biotin--[biotin carboxyl-carrier protein] ligase n=1 Tax=Rhizobium rhododendri TaxID=2506430 RepID=A0ABY8ILB0_9HYPH|nr:MULTISPECIES: biotin--[acetyl-CoA-carboxylase] ligase [Rhizobium]MBZ5760010.1 biotin--[acetyl-CoA-carboxylase] ligase [Rhizobium sp. VS19-DR96]MBZ5766509.1 biotin--[acetyl-CoA-carboxylase] ligase [Rhizobium sp. VS19-DR129.2]MBZ5774148.1 biotin--[acetyl-CoA-carboxylase] ligase [Rhizobium sp. VS19-DRK62.2]MBZ5785220.1 biotin--[acetyl-CoA-carboxylase] ligase [Rhizobium sp. VS19-DR121]MBZ5802819.1 biotin--[acetyl-CoA-carboxylase] ligase [Rhizobium sp. VS19-DR181]